MAKYKITRKMMHKQLRFKGALARKVVPYYKPSTFRVFNKFFKLFEIKDEKITDGIRIRSTYTDRTDGSEHKLRLCVFSPVENGKYDTADGRLPCVVWFHGGGFGQGVPEAELEYVRTFMEVHPCVFIVPAYRLSVEAPYPAAVLRAL